MSDIEERKEPDDVPFHPAIRQSKQGEAERCFAAGHCDDGGETGDVTMDTEADEILERYFTKG